MALLFHSGLCLCVSTVPIYVPEACLYCGGALDSPRSCSLPPALTLLAQGEELDSPVAVTVNAYHWPSGLRGTLEAGVGHAGWGSGTLRGQRLARHGRIPDNWHPACRHLSRSPIPLKSTGTKTPFSAGHGGANPLSTKTSGTDSI